MSFDKYRRKASSDFPMFLSPAALMQLLQFWIPRSEELDRALIGALRLPFLFQDFDKDAEQVTTRILRALSRYENVGDLSSSLVTGVLTNKALRGRLSERREEIQEDVALRDAVMEEAARLDKERVFLAEQLSEVTEQTERQRLAAEEDRIRAQASEQVLKDDLAKTRAKQQQERVAMEQEVSRVRDHEEQLSDEVGRLKKELEEQASLRRFRIWGLVLVVPIAVLGWLVYAALGLADLPIWLRVATALALALGSWMYLAPIMSRSQYVRETRWGRFLTWSGSSLIKLLWVIGISVFSGLLVEFIRTR